MKNTFKYIKLISKLNRLTKEKKLNWKKSNAPFALMGGHNTVSIDFYHTYYAHTYLGIGEIRFEDYSDYHDRSYWNQKIVWALLDKFDEVRYELPGVEGLSNLLETIRYSTADVEKTIDHLIDAPEDDLDDDEVKIIHYNNNDDEDDDDYSATSTYKHYF